VQAGDTDRVEHRQDLVGVGLGCRLDPVSETLRIELGYERVERQSTG
jgi:hypothetical protein